ncbi:MAG: hypothetical protein AAF790_15425, partial [Planctomycetota bacterium]
MPPGPATPSSATPDPGSPLRPRRRWPWLAAYWLLIFVGSHTPQEHASLPELGPDKLVHLVAYFGLTWLLAWT